MLNAFTVDVEDWFQVAAFSKVIDRDAWDSLPCRVERNVDLILDLLARRQTTATFFTLGWVAKRYPALARRIVDAGHEIASHGYSHRTATEQTRAEFTNDLKDAKSLLEDITGRRILGYRAPSFSIGTKNMWAHDVVAETGHEYSSSIYPVRHDLYGVPDAPRHPYRAANGLLEIPPSTVRLMGRNFPASGGGFFRLLPYGISSWAYRRITEGESRPAMFYCHPWEIDPGQPRVERAGLKSRFRHYLNLDRTLGRMDRLLQDFRWTSVERAFSTELRTAACSTKT